MPWVRCDVGHSPTVPFKSVALLWRGGMLDAVHSHATMMQC